MTQPIARSFNSFQDTTSASSSSLKKIKPICLISDGKVLAAGRVDSAFTRIISAEEKLERRYREATKLESPCLGSRSVIDLDESKMKVEISPIKDDPSPDSFLAFCSEREDQENGTQAKPFSDTRGDSFDLDESDMEIEDSMLELTSEIVELDLAFTNCNMIAERERNGASISLFKQRKQREERLSEKFKQLKQSEKSKEREIKSRSKISSVHKRQLDCEDGLEKVNPQETPLKAVRFLPVDEDSNSEDERIERMR